MNIEFLALDIAQYGLFLNVNCQMDLLRGEIDINRRCPGMVGKRR